MAFLFIVDDEYDGETINDRLHVLLTRGRDSFQKPDPSLSNKVPSSSQSVIRESRNSRNLETKGEREREREKKKKRNMGVRE